MNNKYYKKVSDYDRPQKPNVVEATVTHHELVETDVMFEPPKHDEILDIVDVNNAVGLFRAEVKDDDFVYVKGYIYKSILYTTAKKPDIERLSDFKNRNMYSDQYGEECNEDERENCAYCDYMNYMDGGNSCLYRSDGEDEGRDNREERNEREGRDNREERNEREGRNNNDKKDNKDGKNSKDGKSDKDKKDGKKDREALDPVRIDGVLRHSTICIPFECNLHVEGARAGDNPTADLEFTRNSEGSCVIRERDKVRGVKESDVVRMVISLNRCD